MATKKQIFTLDYLPIILMLIDDIENRASDAKLAASDSPKSVEARRDEQDGAESANANDD